MCIRDRSCDSDIPDCFNPRVLAGGRDKRHHRRDEIPHCFNPRVLAGGRDAQAALVDADKKFQSTRPRGRTRLTCDGNFSLEIRFNPRVLAGGRD